MNIDKINNDNYNSLYNPILVSISFIAFPFVILIKHRFVSLRMPHMKLAPFKNIAQKSAQKVVFITNKPRLGAERAKGVIIAPLLDAESAS